MQATGMVNDHLVTCFCHENCSGWGGLSAENSNILLGEVNSSALKVVFDTGNPVTYGQDAWEYYQVVFNDIVYVHIKDAKKSEVQVAYAIGLVRSVSVLVETFGTGRIADEKIAKLVENGVAVEGVVNVATGIAVSSSDVTVHVNARVAVCIPSEPLTVTG